jgi:hypothetical protein
MGFGVLSIKKKLLFFLNGCKGFFSSRRSSSPKHAAIKAAIRHSFDGALRATSCLKTSHSVFADQRLLLHFFPASAAPSQAELVQRCSASAMRGLEGFRAAF